MGDDIVKATATVSHDGKQFLVRLPTKIADILFNMDPDTKYRATFEVDVEDVHETGERITHVTIREQAEDDAGD